MHPIFRLQNIEQAPPSHRNTLRDAVRGGPRALSSLRAVERGIAGRAQPKHVLPVLYATLDPSPILEASSSDTPSPFPDSLVDRVLICIGILGTMLEDERIPSHAFASIWPRLFDWVLFVENCHDSHCDLGRGIRRAFFVGFVMAAAQLVTHEPTRDIIEATPGFRTLIGRIWLSFPESWDEPDIPWRPLGILLMDNLLLQDPNNLREFAAAFDGGESELAAFVIKHIAPASIEYVAPAMDVILKTQENQRFFGILLNQRLMPALTRLIAFYASQKDAANYLAESLVPFSRPFEMTRAFHWITEALHAGFLEAIITAGTNYPNHPGTIKYLQWFFVHVLTQALVYLPAVVEVSRTLDHCLSLAAAPAFQKSAVFAAWKTFVGLAQNSLQYLAYYSRPDRPRSLQLCYNVQCGKLLPRKSTKRCPLCRICHYCSEDCQRVDWVDGKHRKECADLYSLRVASPEHLSARNRDFLRTIVEFEYIRDRRMWYLTEIDTTQRCPNDEFCLLIDYSSGKRLSRIILVRLLLQAQGLETESGHGTTNGMRKFEAELRYHLARAKKSGGRRQVAVIKVGEGECATARIVLVEHVNGRLRDGLREVARRIPVGAVRERMDQVGGLMAHLMDEPVPEFVYASA